MPRLNGDFACGNTSFKNGSYVHFPNFQRSQPADQFTFITVIRELKAEFASSFAEFCLQTCDLSLFGTPFNADIESVPNNLQMEVIEKQCKEQLESKFDADDVSD